MDGLIFSYLIVGILVYGLIRLLEPQKITHGQMPKMKNSPPLPPRKRYRQYKGPLAN